MEVIPALSGWLSSRQKVLLDTITGALAEAHASPGEAAVNAIKGMARGGLQLADLVASPMLPPSMQQDTAEKLLPSNASSMESVGEFLGPPMKLGAKLAGVVAPKAAMAVAGAFPLHANMNKMFENLLAGGHSEQEAKNMVKYAWSSITPDQKAIKAWTPGMAAEESKLTPMPENWLEQKPLEPFSASKAAAKMEEEFPLPPIDPKLLNAQEHAPLTGWERLSRDKRPLPPVDPRLLAHGLDSADVAEIQRLSPSRTTDRIIQEYEEAQRAAAAQGMHPANTAQDRALAMQYPDPTTGDEGYYMMRGNKTPREVVLSAKEAGVPSAHSSRDLEVAFASEAGPLNTNYKTYGPIHTPLLSNVPASALFDPANPEHQAAFLKRHNELYGLEPEGAKSGKQHLREWNQERGGAAAAWDAIETPPDVLSTIKDLGFPGVRTVELGENRAVFDTTDWRHPLAAFNPEKKNIKNIFANFGPVTALGALLAAKGLPVEDAQQQ